MIVKNLILGIGIVVIYTLVLWQGIEAFYPSPQYDEFCQGRNSYYADPIVKPIRPGINCTINPSPQQRDLCNQDGGNLVTENYDEQGCPVSYKCDYCNKEFDEANENYQKRVFFISLIVGIITLIVGFAVLSVEPVGSAMMASGVWAIFYGTAWNWVNLGSVWRFLFLLIALILLIWIAMRLNTQKGSFWQKLGLRKR